MLSVASPDVNISKALSIGGWMSEGELLWLATQARSHQYIVEFGSLHGRSTMAMASNLMPNGKIWAVDPWAGDTYEEIHEDNSRSFITTYVMPYFIKNLKEYIDIGQVEAVREFSYRFSLPQKVDMVFIDGDHRYETVVKDIKKARELLKPDGLLCGHDYDHPHWPGVKIAVDELVNNVGLLKENSLWWEVKS